VQDGEIVEAITAGDPAGLAVAYDRYAPGLYAYCRSLLTEPADAADAVQDTFIITTAKVGGLRDPERLRPWLYAVARNECFRQLRSLGLSAPLDEAPEVTAGEPDPAAGPGREELRALVAAALTGLNPGDREVIELNLRHTLDGADLADALGVSRNQAHALVSRARSQFEGSLGALLVARVGREACPDLDDILAGWDGELTILLRQRVNRHIENCEVCGERKRRELSPAMLLSMLPMVALPPGLRQQIFRLAADRSPAGVGYRDLVVRRAVPFSHSGFPRPIESPRRIYGVRTMAAAASVAIVAAALLGTGTVFVLEALHHKGATPVSAATIGPTAAPEPMASGSHRAKAGTGGTNHHSGSDNGGSVGGNSQPSPTAQPGSGPGSSSGPGSGSQPTGSPRPTPSRHSHSPSPPPSPPPSPGTLGVAPGSVTLTQASPGGPYTGQFTIIAQGGPVSGWDIVDPVSAADLSISPLSGSTIPAGQAVTITLTVPTGSGLTFETDLTVNPGGLTVIVDYPPAG
jgi:RNA polymerase sigma factor (sigma-70 family)